MAGRVAYFLYERGRVPNTTHHYVGDRLARLLGSEQLSPPTCLMKAMRSAKGIACCQDIDPDRTCFCCCLTAPTPEHMFIEDRQRHARGMERFVAEAEPSQSTLSPSASASVYTAGQEIFLQTTARVLMWLTDMNTSLAVLAQDQRRTCPLQFPTLQPPPQQSPHPSEGSTPEMHPTAPVKAHSPESTTVSPRLQQQLSHAQILSTCLMYVCREIYDHRKQAFFMWSKHAVLMRPCGNTSVPTDAVKAANERLLICQALGVRNTMNFKSVLQHFRLALESLLGIYFLLLTADEPLALSSEQMASLLARATVIMSQGTVLELRLTVMVLQVLMVQCASASLMGHVLLTALLEAQQALLIRCKDSSRVLRELMDDFSGPFGHIVWSWVASAAVQHKFSSPDLLDMNIETLKMSVSPVANAKTGTTQHQLAYLVSELSQKAPRGTWVSGSYVHGWVTALEQEAAVLLSWMAPFTVTLSRPLRSEQRPVHSLTKKNTTLVSSEAATAPVATSSTTTTTLTLSTPTDDALVRWVETLVTSMWDGAMELYAAQPVDLSAYSSATVALLAVVRPPAMYNWEMGQLFMRQSSLLTVGKMHALTQLAPLLNRSPAGCEWDSDPVVSAAVRLLATPAMLQRLVAHLRKLLRNIEALSTHGNDIFSVSVVVSHLMQTATLTSGRGAECLDTLTEGEVNDMSESSSAKATYTLLADELVQAMYASLELACILCMHPVSAALVRDHGAELQRLLRQPFSTSWDELPTGLEQLLHHQYATRQRFGVRKSVTECVHTSMACVHPRITTTIALRQLHLMFPEATSPPAKTARTALLAFIKDSKIRNDWLTDACASVDLKRRFLGTLLQAALACRNVSSHDHGVVVPNVVYSILEAEAILEDAVYARTSAKKMWSSYGTLIAAIHSVRRELAQSLLEARH